MITLDVETKSYADLKKVGAWPYSEDPTTEIICLCYGIDDAPIQSWWPGKHQNDDMPKDLHVALLTEHVVEAHHVSFEMAIWYNILAPSYGWMIPGDHQWRDLMAVACYYALPASLDRLAYVLKFEGKSAAGGYLITRYSKLHLKTAKLHIPDHEWIDYRDMTKKQREENLGCKEAGGYYCEDFSLFVKYCKHDVAMVQAISDYLGDLPDREVSVFLLDLVINRRGIYLDQKGIAAASAIVDQRSKELTLAFRELTGLNPTQGDKIRTWCKARGHELENLQADYLEELLEGDLHSGPVREAIGIRLRINKASTKKLDKMALQCCSDGRARFQTRYHGAATGRSTGSGFQPLNLNRGYDGMNPEQLVQGIRYGDAKFLDALYGDAMDAVAKASRYWIKAELGNKIIAGDYSSFEAVILACVAGEQWKVDAFREGVKIYEHMADKIHGLAPGIVTKATHPTERQDGKTGELAFGYQGALGAWLKFDTSGRHSDKRIIEICRSWRKEHPAVVDLWYGLERAAIEALQTGRSVSYSPPAGQAIAFEKVDDWLTMILPDGKRLWYRDAHLALKWPQWHKPAEYNDCFYQKCDCEQRPQVVYMAQKAGQWRQVTTYGGKITENAIQAIQRQFLAPAIERVEEAGYKVILTIYDEIVCEVPLGFGSPEELANLMKQSPGPWADNWPVNVSAWEGDRYRK